MLASIIEATGVPANAVAYVGDSLMKDVAMAQAVEVHDVYAAYGRVQDNSDYELLRRVSHWTDVDIARERDLARHPVVTPTYTLHERFDEILELFEFGGL